MIVVDTSAIVAVLFGEQGSGELERRLLQEPCVMSAATRVALGIVIEAKTGAAGKQLLEELLGRLAMQVVPVDADLDGGSDRGVASLWERASSGGPERRRHVLLRGGASTGPAVALRRRRLLPH